MDVVVPFVEQSKIYALTKLLFYQNTSLISDENSEIDF
ncbi:hypothetical protein SALWKB29_0449 [Snodgrassella communis]|uniref:Uncharacterized protein n=1 Tax=Snodgrassella communis TaxID=2946699 RepID=A0A836MRZ8_9NEIS|nr:hypothetical protein SALWKB29_0449 [Snodgrassella communis]